MTPLCGNLLKNLPDASGSEVTEVLARLAGDGSGTRVERIVTAGQATPPGVWYDQPGDEWVAVLAGEAEVEFAEPDGRQRLAAGDWLLIPARCRHRVAAAGEGTVWLAVHAGGGAEK